MPTRNSAHNLCLKNVFKINKGWKNGLWLVLTICIREKATVELNTNVTQKFSSLSSKWIWTWNKTNKKKIQFHQLPSSLLNTQWCSLNFWLPKPVMTMATSNINYEPQKKLQLYCFLSLNNLKFVGCTESKRFIQNINFTAQWTLLPKTATPLAPTCSQLCTCAHKMQL
jgi:hypothetical protein